MRLPGLNVFIPNSVTLQSSALAFIAFETCELLAGNNSKFLEKKTTISGKQLMKSGELSPRIAFFHPFFHNSCYDFLYIPVVEIVEVRRPGRL